MIPMTGRPKSARHPAQAGIDPPSHRPERLAPTRWDGPAKLAGRDRATSPALGDPPRKTPGVRQPLQHIPARDSSRDPRTCREKPPPRRGWTPKGQGPTYTRATPCSASTTFAARVASFKDVTRHLQNDRTRCLGPIASRRHPRPGTGRPEVHPGPEARRGTRRAPIPSPTVRRVS